MESKIKNLELDSTVFDVELRRNELIEVKKSGYFCFSLCEFLISR